MDEQNTILSTAEAARKELTLPPMPDFRLAEIVQELADSGAGVVELIRHTKSLEDIFLSLTQSAQEVREK